MKVAVAAKGDTLDSRVNDLFGRSPFFVVVHPESMEFDAIENPGVRERDVAGVQASRTLISKGVDVVVARNIGHNALVTLDGAGIKVYLGATGTVLDAIETLRKGELTSAERPTVGFQHGLDADK
jgi:predicted Fe-Mo cluster-binding NifX family protein